MIFTTHSLDGIYISYNLGNFILDSTIFIQVPYQTGAGYNLCCGDFDGNGFNDIALINTGGGTGSPYHNLTLFFNDGNGNFGPNPINNIPDNTSSKIYIITVHPNPFHDQTRFDITLKETSKVDLSIFDAKGKLIKCLMNKEIKGGKFIISWNGKNENNQTCPPGVYLSDLKINGNSKESLKILKTF